ncbi:BTAD domain-containing putative transcriptional regulator [Streptomyces sp. NPDC006430]|uniref:AfsR/SARP family transcriptional regulator n=1 Tax=Streptomyces sp. NPDC006430 TaxID=3154299 RepID=UPI0033A8BC0A
MPRLIEYVWGDAAPPSAVNCLQTYISRLRCLLDPDRDGSAGRIVRSAPGGYSLHARGDQIDSVTFERLVARGQALLRSGDAEAAHYFLADALSLWRGPALADLDDHQPLVHEISRLEELRIVARECNATALLRLGGHEEAVLQLEPLVRENPLRESLRAQLMLALYRGGRQAEALAMYRRTREMFIDELGVEPGEKLAWIQQAILRQDPALSCDPSIPLHPDEGRLSVSGGAATHGFVPRPTGTGADRFTDRATVQSYGIPPQHESPSFSQVSASVTTVPPVHEEPAATSGAGAKSPVQGGRPPTSPTAVSEVSNGGT